jgi:hypothetical protein
MRLLPVARQSTGRVALSAAVGGWSVGSATINDRDWKMRTDDQ